MRVEVVLKTQITMLLAEQSDTLLFEEPYVETSVLWVDCEADLCYKLIIMI